MTPDEIMILTVNFTNAGGKLCKSSKVGGAAILVTWFDAELCGYRVTADTQTDAMQKAYDHLIQERQKNELNILKDIE